jgi:hypothetical protein
VLSKYLMERFSDNTVMSSSCTLLRLLIPREGPKKLRWLLSKRRQRELEVPICQAVRLPINREAMQG